MHPTSTLIRTKIICTIGPSVSNYEKILELIDAGMNVARLNFSHGTLEQHRETIAILKKARKDKGIPLAIMLDTKGPEIRIGKVPDGSFSVKLGQRVYLSRKTEEGKIRMVPEAVFDCLQVGNVLLFDDGYIVSKIVDKDAGGIWVEVQNSGFLKDHKGVNIPDVHLPLPAMTQEDIDSLVFGCREDVDLIAASFIRSAEHVSEIKRLLQREGKPDICVIAKIENKQGVENFDEILHQADGIMVARGDLGVELPLYRVPSLQKMMISKCCAAGKPVITATQMLESMIQNPRPTRAEVSDVANAIYDSTSAVMLSGETAVGKYPVEAVKMMRSIIVEAESQFDYPSFFYASAREKSHDVASSVALAAVNTAYALEAKAIFTFTAGGATAALISRFRPKIPIFALTSKEEVYHRMALLWGVIPTPPYLAKDSQDGFGYISCFAKQKGILTVGEAVLTTSGSPFDVRGTTNMMFVSKVS